MRKLRWIERFHGNDRGAISVLVLLTLWSLVATLAMLWNTAEYSVKRQHVQASADAAAEGASMWMTRAVNVEAAQNMIIAQDAAAEVIWRAVPPTDKSIKAELTAEQTLAQEMIDGKNVSYNNQRSNLTRLLTQVDTEYAQTQDALAQLISGADGLSFADDAAKTAYTNKLRQASMALQWVNGTYVDGGAPAVAGWPGPPGPNGEGLRKMVAEWQASPDDDAMLQAILASLTQQLAILQQFEDRTQPATSQAVDQQMLAHEQQVFQTESEVSSQLTDAVENQRAALADFDKTDVTLATVLRPDGADGNGGGPAQLQTPVMTADAAESVSHFDSIQQRDVEIDPINPNTGDAAIVHPPVVVGVPASVAAQYPEIGGSFTVNCNVPGGWGHSWAFPLEQYLSNRVWNDQSTLNSSYMAPIDALRQQLAQLLAQMRGVGVNNVRGLPNRLADPQGGQIDVLPRVTPPNGADAAYRSEATIYNQHAGTYTGRVRALANALNGFAAFFDRFTRPFAVQTWTNAVSNARFTVMQNVGTAKGFMVLSTYALRDIPEWAQGGMAESARVAVRDRIIQQNITPVTNQVVNALIKADPWGLGGGFLDPAGQNQYLKAMYSGLAAQIAQAIVQQAADSAAPEIAAEMVSRPWPFEITPPDEVVPPSRGMSKDDRLNAFTVIAAARARPETAPRPLLSTVFGQPANQLVAFAQGETFNWMEYNASYGLAERFDVVSASGYFNEFFCCPRAWRLSMPGGWAWQTRLSLTDGLGAAMENNPELVQFLSDAGITNPDPDALDAAVMH